MCEEPVCVNWEMSWKTWIIRAQPHLESLKWQTKEQDSILLQEVKKGVTKVIQLRKEWHIY